MDPEQIPLRDLHLPEAIGWWPLAPGWWVVVALVAGGLYYLFRLYLRTRARGAARRQQVGCRTTNAATAAGNECDSPINTCHFASPVRLWHRV